MSCNIYQIKLRSKRLESIPKQPTTMSTHPILSIGEFRSKSKIKTYGLESESQTNMTIA